MVLSAVDFWPIGGAGAMRAVSPKVQVGASKYCRCKSFFSAHELVPVVWSETSGSRVGRAWVEDGRRAERVEEDSRNFEVLHPALVGVLRFQCGQSQVSGSVNSCHGNDILLVGKMTQPARLKLVQAKRDPRIRSPPILAKLAPCNNLIAICFLPSRSRVRALDILFLP